MANRQDDSKEAHRIEKDAKGQFAPAQSGRRSDGVSSAKASVVTGTDDATFDNDPGDEDSGKKPAGRSRNR